ncbi:MAG: hypothetical protein ABIO70_10560 [Pseudomonadota bacterium]
MGLDSWWEQYLLDTPPMFREDVAKLVGLAARLLEAQISLDAVASQLDSDAQGPEHVIKRHRNALEIRDHWEQRIVERLRKVPGMTPGHMIEVMRYVRTSLGVEK